MPRRGRIPVDIQLFTDKPNQVLIDGVDYINANYLLIEFTPNGIKFLVGTMPPKQLEEENEPAQGKE